MINNKLTIKTLGTLEVTNGLIDITDPCYDFLAWGRINKVKIREGLYNCELSKVENSLLVYSISIVHEEAQVSGYSEVLDLIEVDSGLAGFFISPKKDYTEEEWSKFHSDLYPEEDCFENPIAWVNQEGFFSKSGYGAGTYSVYCHRNKEYQIDALKIVFVN